MGSGFSSRKPAPVVDQLNISHKNDLEVKKKSEEEIKQEQHQMYLKNLSNLKTVFKKLDPGVLNYSGEIEGELKISYKLAENNSILLVKVILAQNLTARDLSGEVSNPFVKVSLLLPQEYKSDDIENSFSTRVVRNSKNPVFNEIFSFQWKENFQMSKISFSVWSSDSPVDDFMGESEMILEEVTSEPKVVWMTLKPQTDKEIGGTLHFSINFELPQNLFVSVLKVDKLTKTRASLKPYVRLYIPGVPYLHKTSSNSSEDPCNPHWDECFEFPVTKEEFLKKSLVAIVSDVEDESAYLGEVHIDLNPLAKSHKMQGSCELQDLRASKARQSRWAKCVLKDEFEEALNAHANFSSPNFLFSKVVNGSYNQAISVRIPKTEASQRLRLVDGVLLH